jgi:hypothetical protein
MFCKAVLVDAEAGQAVLQQQVAVAQVGAGGAFVAWAIITTELKRFLWHYQPAEADCTRR